MRAWKRKGKKWLSLPLYHNRRKKGRTPPQSSTEGRTKEAGGEGDTILYFSPMRKGLEERKGSHRCEVIRTVEDERGGEKKREAFRFLV